MFNQNLSGKNILLFAPQGKGIYGSAILTELIAKGALVRIYNERPSTSTLSKSLYRLAKKRLQFHFSIYIKRVIQEVKHIEFDYILIIRGEAFSPDGIKKLRQNFQQARFILYLWDSLINNDARALFPFFDRVFSFDLEDCQKHRELIFRPLFYTKEYEKNAGLNNFVYDLVFIGTVHSNRLLFIKRIENYLKKHNLKTFSYLYFPSRLLYLRKNITDKNFKGYTAGDFNYKMISAEKVSEILSKSKASLDMQAPTQSGLTMRTIEVLGTKRKLITTNQQIKKYNFYNENNIQIIDENFKNIDLSFFQTPYKELSNEIYEKYSLSYWLDEVLSLV